MGMYTQLFLSVTLEDDTPADVLDVIQELSYGNTVENPPEHPFFSCGRYHMLFCGDSAYFGGSSICRFNRDNLELTIVSSLKNYDSEIEKFINWIIPYVSYGAGTDDLLGYYIYEESEEPTLIYKRSLEDNI